MKLTRIERWILSNQYRILEKLDSGRKDEYAQVQEALNCGYELDYKSLCEHVYDNGDSLSEEQCREVRDIMAMFVDLGYSYSKLPDKADIDKNRVRFYGFSANLETTYLGYARYLQRCGAYSEIGRDTDELDSHAPYLPMYRAMLKQWNKFNNRGDLCKEEIIAITSVKYPG